MKDSSSAATGAASFPRSARVAASPWTAAAPAALVSWVPVSQAQASWMTSRGEERVVLGRPDREPVPGSRLTEDGPEHGAVRAGGHNQRTRHDPPALPRHQPPPGEFRVLPAGAVRA
ncbi:MAG: hypothetical protein ACRDRJ_03905 [Streptosporangiaceae bacterium]